MRCRCSIGPPHSTLTLLSAEFSPLVVACDCPQVFARDFALSARAQQPTRTRRGDRIGCQAAPLYPVGKNVIGGSCTDQGQRPDLVGVTGASGRMVYFCVWRRHTLWWCTDTSRTTTGRSRRAGAWRQDRSNGMRSAQ